MTYRSFDPATMAAVSTPLVDPAQERPLLEAIPLLVPVLPMLDIAHQGVVDIGAAKSRLDKTLKALADTAESVDKTHDQKYRGIYNVLTDWAELVSDPALSLALLALRDHLCREGLGGVRRSYLAEAGNVDIARENVTDEMLETLAGITCGPVSLKDELGAWFEAGTRLGQVERERAQLASDSKNDTTEAKEIALARHNWSKVMGVLLGNLDLAGESVDEKTRTRILEPLRNAEKKQAEARRRGSSGDTPPKDLDAPLDTDADDSSDASTGTGE